MTGFELKCKHSTLQYFGTIFTTNEHDFRCAGLQQHFQAFASNVMECSLTLATLMLFQTVHPASEWSILGNNIIREHYNEWKSVSGFVLNGNGSVVIICTPYQRLASEWMGEVNVSRHNGTDWISTGYYWGSVNCDDNSIPEIISFNKEDDIMVIAGSALFYLRLYTF